MSRGLGQPLARPLSAALGGALSEAMTTDGAGAATLPALDSLIGAWYADEYVASPRPLLPNSVSAVATSQNLLCSPRRRFIQTDFWGRQSATYTEGQADPLGGTDATRVNGAGDWYIFPNSAPVLPAGTYTIGITARSHGGAGTAQFRMEFLGAGLVSGTKTATASYQRFSFTGTVGAGPQTILFMRSFDAATSGDLDIIDAGLYAGASDPGEPALAGHCYLGLDAYSAPPCASGVLDLTSAGFGIIQFPDDLALDEFTLIAVANKTVDNTTFNAALSKQDNYTAFGPLLDNSKTLLSWFAGTPVTGSVPLESTAQFYSKGWKVSAHRYASGFGSIFVNNVELVRSFASPTTPASVKELLLGAFQAIGNTGGYKFNSVLLWRTGLTNDEVEEAAAFVTARAAESALSLTTTDRFYVAEGDSITVDSSSYARLFGTNASPTVFGATLAVAGDKVTNMESRASRLDEMIKSPLGGRTYILSVLIGANDLGAVTVPDFIAQLSSYCDDRRAAGWMVVVCTLLPNTNVGFNTARGIVNTAIRTWPGVHADAIADFAAEVTVGTDAAASNPTYYPDGIHPSAAAHALLEPILRAVVNAL